MQKFWPLLSVLTFLLGAVVGGLYEKAVPVTPSPVSAVASAKERIRELFMEVDPAILSRVDSGATVLTVRMQPGDLKRLRAMIADGGETLVSVTGTGRVFRDSLILNGSLGPSNAVPEQQEITVAIGPALRRQ